MTNETVRTLVVIETDNERHVYELDAEATETYENPKFNPSHRFGPLRLEVEGAVLRHVVYERQDGDDLLRDQGSIEPPHAEIEANDG